MDLPNSQSLIFIPEDFLSAFASRRREFSPRKFSIGKKKARDPLGSFFGATRILERKLGGGKKKNERKGSLRIGSAFFALKG